MEIFFTITAIAGGAVLWRNWLEHHPSWKIWLQRKLGVLSTALLCGSCFTYWLSLATILIYNPFDLMRPEFGSGIWLFLGSWMATSFCAVFLRFLYVLIQEMVSEKVHRHEHKT